MSEKICLEHNSEGGVLEVIIGESAPVTMRLNLQEAKLIQEMIDSGLQRIQYSRMTTPEYLAQLEKDARRVIGEREAATDSEARAKVSPKKRQK